MAAAASLSHTINLDNTYGALFIGLLAAAVLFGITNLQVFVYSQSYQEDRIWSKIAVGWLWILDAFHLALISHSVYFYLVTNYANPLKLIYVVWSFHLQLVVDMVTILTVQALYAIRLWQLAEIDNRGVKTKIVPTMVTLLVFAAAGVCVAVSKLVYDITYFTEVDRIRWATILALGTASVVDILIAASLCFTLMRLRTGIKRTDSMINSLMLYILNTGVLTSCCSITALIVYGVYPHNFVFLAVEFLLTKLYVNSFLAMFNARNHLQAMITRTIQTSKADVMERGGITRYILGNGTAKVDAEKPKVPGMVGTLVFAHGTMDSGGSNSTSGDEGISDIIFSPMEKSHKSGVSFSEP